MDQELLTSREGVLDPRRHASSATLSVVVERSLSTYHFAKSNRRRFNSIPCHGVYSTYGSLLRQPRHVQAYGLRWLVDLLFR